MTAPPSTTGDVRNSLWAARSALRRLRAPAEIAEASGLLRGEPSAILPALRFVFNRYPRTLERCATAAAVGGGGACCRASEQDATAAGNDAPCSSSFPSSSSVASAGRALLSASCPPARFATAAVRALRHGLGIERVGLTPGQLLERGYAERKLLLLAEAAKAAREIEAQSAAAAQRLQVESVVFAVLTREHGRLQPETIGALEAYFASLGGSEGGQKWRVGRARVDPRTGAVAIPSTSTLPLPSDDGAAAAAAAAAASTTAADSLGPVDLEPHEWAAFSEGVAALALSRERSPRGEFENFVAWCQDNGPFDAVVDGANVALYGQNWAHGDFSFPQIEAVVEELKRMLGPGSKTLVVLHRSRLLSAPAKEPAGRRVLNSLASAAAATPAAPPPGSAAELPPPAQALLYAAPHGSNDDWYWLHAAVAAREKGLMVSNDEMRDHVFQLLSPRFAARWKDRHQAKYTFFGNYHGASSSGCGGGSSGVSAMLILPPPFSECSQKVPRTGAWLFPRAVAEAGQEEGSWQGETGNKKKIDGGDGVAADPNEWLCCSPVSDT